MGENGVFLVIFDTCDIMHNWSISLLPHIVRDNLFGEGKITFINIKEEGESCCQYKKLIYYHY